MFILASNKLAPSLGKDRADVYFTLAVSLIHCSIFSTCFSSICVEAEKIPPGADGLLFVPYLLGERAPIWDASAQGTLLGMQITHTQSHLVRATLEGILFGLFQITEILIPDEEKRKNTTVMVSGGFGKSEFWLQIVADIFQMKVAIPNTIEGAAWGAVLIGLKATSGTVNTKQNIRKTFIPNQTNAEVYKEAFTRFKKVYTLLKEI